MNAEDRLRDHRLCVSARVKELPFDLDILLFLVLAFLNLIRAWAWHSLCNEKSYCGYWFGG